MSAAVEATDFTVADALRKFAPDYIDKYRKRMPPHHHKVLRLITRCKTGQLGSVAYRCDSCQAFHWMGRSCGNRILSVDDSVVRYKVKPSGEATYQTRRLSGESFVRCFAQHILPPGFKKIRYYGFLSPNCRLQLADARWLIWMWLGWTLYLGSILPKPPVPQRTPPACPRCQSEMRLIGITDSHGQWLWRSLVISRGPPSGQGSPSQLEAQSR